MEFIQWDRIVSGACVAQLLYALHGPVPLQGWHLTHFERGAVASAANCRWDGAGTSDGPKTLILLEAAVLMMAVFMSE